MNAFDYAAPQSVDEAVSLLGAGNGDVGVLAGGTDLIAQLKENRRKIDLLLDLKRIPEATALRFDEEEGLHIGAATPCSQIYTSDVVQSRYPALVDCTSLIGSIQIQNRGSMGGNFCNASPAADTPPSVIVQGGVCCIVGPRGVREVAAEDFFLEPGQSALRAGELLIAIRVPVPAANSGAFFLRFIPRNEMDIAVANAAAAVVLDEGKATIQSARVSIGAVAPTPLLVSDAGDALAGKSTDDEDAIQTACEAARAAANPISDMRGTIEQRVHLSGVLTGRAIRGAIQRAKES